MATQNQNQDQNRQGGQQSQQGDINNRGSDKKETLIASESDRAERTQGTRQDSEQSQEGGRKVGQAPGGSADRDVKASDQHSQGADRSAQQAQDRERDEQGQFTSDSARSSQGRSDTSQRDN